MAIQLPDARELSDEVLEAIRLRVLRRHELGLAARGSPRFSAWLAKLSAAGGRRIGRRSEGDWRRTRRSANRFGRTLDNAQAAQIQARIQKSLSRHLGNRLALWTRQAVRDLIRNEFDIDMPIRTVGEYVKHSGYTPKKPDTKRSSRTPKNCANRWKTYPAIGEIATKEGGEIPLVQ